ncbi:hypothetical protein [Paenibacillus agricola]|uniref:Fimbrial assembly protein n=1 Tax=Paenibacillus agricola TaxID=2716264 RepID=A0ABX0J423_9BACL|nr:hypothetical protein [Paenibacillus agricola]NHN29578.1 hypothetical protein [Paenibacillus agricola]
MKLEYNINWISLDINLMQKREPGYSSVIVPILLILAAMGATGAFGWLWYEEQSKLASAQKQLAEVTQLVSALEKKLQENNSGGQLGDLLSQPKLLKQQKPVATALLQQLNKLLPLHANVIQLEMNGQELLKLTLNFATSEDVVSFSQSVQAAEHFKLIRMGAINNVTNTLGNTAVASADVANANGTSIGHVLQPQEQQLQGSFAQEQLPEGQPTQEQHPEIQPVEGQPIQQNSTQEGGQSRKLPIYQTTFELKYTSDGKRG